MRKKQPVIPLIDLREHLQIERQLELEKASATPWRDLGVSLLRLGWAVVKSLVLPFVFRPDLDCGECCSCRRARGEDYDIWVESSR